MGNTFYFSFEPVLMENLQKFFGDGGSTFIAHFSFFGEEVALMLVLGFLYWCYDKKFAVYVGTNVILGVVLNPLIKNIALRRRPYFDNPGIKCLRPVKPEADIYDIAAQGYSFPSGHSMNTAIAYGSLARYTKNRVITIISVIITFLVGIARILAGVHYPTDVLIGWATGIAVIFAVPAIYNRFGEEKRSLANLVIFIICCAGMFYCHTEDYFTGMGLLGGFFLAMEFEKRFVNFEGTAVPIKCALRIVGGGLVYLVFNTVLKLPFSAEFLDSGTFAAFMIRTIRYCIVSFLMLGVYPMTFKFFKKK